MFLQPFSQSIKNFVFSSIINITKHIIAHVVIIYGVIIPEDSFFGVNILSEFLESFYVKYGSFIPLSHTDVLEYLKKNGNTDLSHRFVDTHTHSWCFKSVLYDISHGLREQPQISAQWHFHCKPNYAQFQHTKISTQFFENFLPVCSGKFWTYICKM